MLFQKRRTLRFGGRNNALPRAVAFVDYEHWYISMEKIHHRRPNIQAWFDDLKQTCNIVEVIFFGNFSKFREKEKEIKRIRAFTNKIIDTYNPDMYYKKDYTDFIILDNIYQKALLNQDIETFIIFSGDGHFSSAAAFLKNFCNKKVCIYGVKGCISSNLVKSADVTREVPFPIEVDAPYYNMIFHALKAQEAKRDAHITFMRTVDAVSANNHVGNDKIRNAMVSLIHQGYIVQVPEKTQKNESVRTLCVNWQKVNDDNIWIKDAVLI